MKKFALLVFVFALFLSTPVVAAEPININTADATLLETLPGIGPVKAQAIIEYRQTNGPFAAIADIQNVSGIGPVTFANIQSLITVGNENAGESAPPPETDTDVADSAATSTVSTQASGGGTPEYLPIPQLRLVIQVSGVVAANAETAFTASAYDAQGRKRSDAIISWSFGDGMQRTGASVLHQFYAPGKYVVVVQAKTDDGGDESEDLIVIAEDAGVSIASVTYSGITLLNSSSRSLDLSWWRLRVNGKEFKFPEHTYLLPNHNVTFPSQITELNATNSAELLFPSGEVAAFYPSKLPVAHVQPQTAVVSYKKMQTVAPVTSQAKSTYGTEAVVAPVAAQNVAAAGAALSTTSTSTTTNTSRLGQLARSPWSYGFLGLLVAAGAALLLL